MILPICFVASVVWLAIACRLIPQSLNDDFRRFFPRFSDRLQTRSPYFANLPSSLPSARLDELNEVRRCLYAESYQQASRVLKFLRMVTYRFAINGVAMRPVAIY
jgi:hypothetical protein